MLKSMASQERRSLNFERNRQLALTNAAQAAIDLVVIKRHFDHSKRWL